jgi:hypothetical protein
MRNVPTADRLTVHIHCCLLLLVLVTTDVTTEEQVLASCYKNAAPSHALLT